ncbi:MAG TPA: primosomal protein N', partial [Micavibrio sp.]
MSQSLLFNDDKPENPAHLARTAAVLVPFPVDKAYSYALPAGVDVQPGDYVVVPLGGREVPGVVWDDAPDDVKPGKLKAAVHRYEFPPMPAIERKFIDWVSQYTMTPRGAVLKMALSVPGALEPPKAVQGYVRGVNINALTYQGLSPPRKRVLEAVADGKPRRAAEIAEVAGCTPSVIKTMAAQGLLGAVDIFSQAPCRHPDIDRPRAILSASQSMAADTLCKFVDDGAFHAA